MDFKAKDYQVNSVVIYASQRRGGQHPRVSPENSSPDYRVSAARVGYTAEILCPQSSLQLSSVLSPGEYVSDSHGDSLNRLMYGIADSPTHCGELRRTNKNIYTLDLTDVPAIPDEDWMPPLNTFRYRVKFYYTNAESGTSVLGGCRQEMGQATPSISPTRPATLKQAVAEIVSPATLKNRRPARSMPRSMKLDNTRFNRKKSRRSARRKAQGY